MSARRQLQVAGILVGLATVALVGWGARWRLADWFSGVIASALGLAGRFIPRWPPPLAAVVATRVDRFVDAIEQLAASRRRLASILCLAVAGQLTAVGVLYVALLFLSDPAPAAVLFVVALLRTAAVVPTPGGIGGTEALLTGLLVTVVGTTPAVAGTATVRYRVTAFWIPAAGH